MKNLLITASALAIAVGFSAPAFAATSNADCTAMFSKVDADNNGWVGGTEAKAYLSAIDKAGLKSADANADGRLNADEFVAACEKDAFKDMAR